MIRVRIRRSGRAEEILNRIRAGLDGPTKVKVGFIQGEAGADEVQKATWNEFGTTRIPERPFFRNAMTEHKRSYAALMRNDAKKIVEGSMTLGRSLDRLGLKAQGDVQQSIVDLRNPPNAPATIARKGSSNPLINTGAMRASVTFKVET